MSFDDELRSQTKFLVAARRPPEQAAYDISRAVRAKRRVRRRGVFTASAAVLALMAGVGVWATRSHERMAAAGHAPVTAEFRAGLGVEAHIRVSFIEDRRVLSAIVTNEGVDAHLSYHPLDGSDSDQNYPNPLPLRAGTRMEFDATIIPACARRNPGDVMLQVSSLRPNGDRVTDRFRVADTGQFRRVTHEYCAQGTGVHIQGGSDKWWPDGRTTFLLFVSNPTAHPVTVRSQAYTRGREQWQAASIVVPSRATRPLRVNGRHVLDHDCASSAPWATQHLTVDGKPIRLSQRETGCE